MILFQLLLLIAMAAAKLTVTSSVASERNFSLTDHVVHARRSTFKSPKINNILFMNSSIHHTK